MALTSKDIPSTGDDIFYVDPLLGSDLEYAVTCMIFCNYTGTVISPTPQDVDLTLYLVPVGGSVGSATMVINQLTIPAGETFTFDTEKVILGTGDRIRAVASASSRLSVTVSSMRVS
jgi:hypothetical protein